MEETNTKLINCINFRLFRGLESRSDKSAQFSKMESGWQGVTLLGFLRLQSAKCFSIPPAGREAEKQANSHQRALNRLKNGAPDTHDGKGERS